MGEKFEVRNMLFLDEDRQKIIELGKDMFNIKALFPVDRKAIARRVAMDQNGLPANSYSSQDRYIMERAATIDQAVVESPEWWKNADLCPDESVLDSLYEGIVTWSNEFAEKLKKNKLNKRSEEKQVPA
jgi:hypothetical protein